MKAISYIIIFSLIIFSSCYKKVLDREPLDVISDATLWQDKTLVDARLTQAYAQMTVLINECPELNNPSSGVWSADSDDWNGPYIINEVSDEGTGNWIKGQAMSAKYSGITNSGGILEWWESSYNTIRILNEFVEKMAATSFDDTYKKNRIAEARFLRALNYFAMVKRYGGIPLITRAQLVTDPEDELYKARNKEQEVYDFIIGEVEAIYNDLPDRNNTELGRPSMYVALALGSRAALYAASIAQFGKMQLNGVVGIDVAAAPGYYQKAYDAAKKIMADGQYALYNDDADKTTNFKNIFLKHNNTEVIWAQPHNDVPRNSGGNAWTWDFFQCPKPHAWDAGNQNAPYFEMAQEYEYVNGSSGTIDPIILQGKLWTMDELWANKDPRFFATIYTNGTSWKGGKVDFHNGLIRPDGTVITSGAYNETAALGTQSTDKSFGTGFGVMKYLDEAKDNTDGERSLSGTDYILFRYAEVLLSYAEAAFELGKTNDALDAVNQIRSRAGIEGLSTITREAIRHERKMELAFEGHRYWDVRRWRKGVELLTQNRSGLRYILDYNTKKYKIEILSKYDGANANPVFEEKNYYLPITPTRIGNNSKLVENPGY